MNDPQEAHVIDQPYQIARLRIYAIIKALEIYTEHGIKIARNMPCVKDLRAQYGLTALTYKGAIDQMWALSRQIEAGVAYSELRNGVLHYEYRPENDELVTDMGADPEQDPTSDHTSDDTSD